MDRQLPEDAVLVEQVVHPLRREALGRVVARADLQLVLEARDGIADSAEEVGLDRILDDAVALVFDRFEVRFEQVRVHAVKMALAAIECTRGSAGGAEAGLGSGDA